MKKSIMLAAALAMSTNAFAGTGAQWGYSGEEGPANWAKLSADNYACADGKNQSPINLTGFVEAGLAPIQFGYSVAGQKIINNGHTVQMNFPEGNRIAIDATAFNLLQTHFHAPSENLINGKSYPLEAHFVHADKDGNLAVVAVMFEEGEANTGLEAAWGSMPTKAGDKNSLAMAVTADDLLPANRDYYRFNGSLTTPPCSEGVRWLVMKDSITASKEQIEAFTAVLHGPNNRPLQPLNSRIVLK